MKISQILSACAISVFTSGFFNFAYAEYPASQQTYLSDLDNYKAGTQKVFDLLIKRKQRDAKKVKSELKEEYIKKWSPITRGGGVASVDDEFVYTNKLTQYEIKDWFCYVIPVEPGYDKTYPCAFVADSGRVHLIEVPYANTGRSMDLEGGGFSDADLQSAVYERNKDNMLQLGDKVKFSGSGLYVSFDSGVYTIISDIVWEYVETDAVEWDGSRKNVKILK